MKKNNVISIVLIIVLYSFASYIIAKPYILPSIFEILLSLKNILIHNNFVSIVFYTLSRSLIGLFISLFLAIVLAFISYFNKKFYEIFNPIYVVLKTIPNITYIIISLIWFGKEGSVLLVSTLVVFPILYNTVLTSLNNIDNSLLNANRVFSTSFVKSLIKVYFPLIRSDLLSGLKTACSLAFKVSIMAEILSQAKYGIGAELYYAKNNLIMSDIFAWTIIIIVISYLFDILIDLIKKR